MESSGCFEKYFGDETKLVQQIISSRSYQCLAHYLPASRSLSMGSPDTSAWMSHKHLRVNLLPTWMKSSLSPAEWMSSHTQTSGDGSSIAPCQNFSLLCQMSSSHQILLHLPSKFSPSVLFSPFPPPSSGSGSHLLPDSGFALFNPSFILQPQWTQNNTA